MARKQINTMFATFTTSMWRFVWRPFIPRISKIAFFINLFGAFKVSENWVCITKSRETKWNENQIQNEEESKQWFVEKREEEKTNEDALRYAFYHWDTVLKL